MHKKKRMAVFCMSLVCLLTMVFTQTAYMANTVQVDIPIEQVFNSSITSADSIFQYTITPGNVTDPMPSNNTFDIDGSAIGGTGAITFTQIGTYSYEIELDRAHNATGYVYDRQVYRVTITTRQSAGDLVADVIVRNENNVKTSKILFTHEYRSKETDRALMVDPPVKKTVAGNPSKNGTFKFALTAKEKNQPMPEGSRNGVKIMTIVGMGEKDFGTWNYEKEGTYYYTVSEINEKEDGYEYDTSIYTITDMVKDVNGQLELKRVVTNASNQNVDSYTFINQYTGSEVKGSTGGSASGSVNGPKTGDDSNISLMILSIVIASIVSMICVYYLIEDNRKRKQYSN